MTHCMCPCKQTPRGTINTLHIYPITPAQQNAVFLSSNFPKVLILLILDGDLLTMIWSNCSYGTICLIMEKIGASMSSITTIQWEICCRLSLFFVVCSSWEKVTIFDSAVKSCFLIHMFFLYPNLSSVQSIYSRGTISILIIYYDLDLYLSIFISHDESRNKEIRKLLLCVWLPLPLFLFFSACNVSDSPIGDILLAYIFRKVLQ